LQIEKQTKKEMRLELQATKKVERALKKTQSLELRNPCRVVHNKEPIKTIIFYEVKLNNL
jgi:hypothetical protein